MGTFSVFWAIFIVAITVLVYKIVKPFVRGKKNRLVWLVSIISVCVYSGIGIAYSTIEKKYIVDFFVYILVMGFSFAAFSAVHFFAIDGHPYACLRPETIETNDEEFWDSDFAKKAFISIFILYFLFRFTSLVYPVNKLSSLSITYNAVNNLKNISGENTTIFISLAAYIKPFAYIGLYYAFKKARYVAAFLGLDLFITLLYSGYLSRSYIICVLFIALMLYFNNDLSNTYISLSQKKKRVMMSLGILGPIVIYMMIFLMTIRTTGKDDWTVMSFFSSEIDYPKHYNSISHMVGMFMTPKDMLLHILDSFVPFIPTPGYTANLNVLFSEKVTGVRMDLSWFSVLLPSILGEAKLIFGNQLFPIHAVIISFMTSMITRIVGDNQKMIVLFYYYLTCAMKAARGGYAELSSTVMFNIVIMVIVITSMKMIYSTFFRGKKSGERNEG